MPVFLILVLLTLTAPAMIPIDPPPANEQAERTPEEIVKRALADLSAGDFEAYVTLMHPEALTKLQETMLPVAELAESDADVKAFMSFFDGVESGEDLQAMNPSQWFISFMRGMWKMQPENADILSNTKINVIGHVAEGDDVVHVVYRGTTSYMGAAVVQMDVVSLKDSPDGWRMLLSGEIENFAAMIQARMGRRL